MYHSHPLKYNSSWCKICHGFVFSCLMPTVKIWNVGDAAKFESPSKGLKHFFLGERKSRGFVEGEGEDLFEGEPL